MRATVISLMMLTATFTIASEPGQPLDCSDFEFFLPGLSCTTEIPYPCKEPGSNELLLACLATGANRFTVTGDVFFVRNTNDNNACGGVFNVETYDFVLTDPTGTEQLIARLQDRCIDGTGADIVEVGTFGFDRINGRLVVQLSNWSGQPGGADLYEYGQQRVRISGFATLFDELQSFTPSALSFRVPLQPEGLAAADSFDTYYGDLATLGDFTQAQPLQCDYPAAIPQTGDYLTVTDTTPTPAPGAGYYFVTAVNYQGQRRYGRQSVGGVLSGRDPALLPECLQTD